MTKRLWGRPARLIVAAAALAGIAVLVAGTATARTTRANAGCGTVTSSSSGIKVGGDIIAGGNIEMKSDSVTIGGKIHSGAEVKLTNTGSATASVGGTVTAAAAVPTIGTQWKKADGTALTGVKGAAPANSRPGRARRRSNIPPSLSRRELLLTINPVLPCPHLGCLW